MEIINVKGRKTPLPEDLAIALGTFDGVHRGHVKIIEAVLKGAQGKKTAVYTFSNIPATALGISNKKQLSTLDQKAEFMSKLGIDYFLYEEFDESIASQSPEEFEDFLANVLRAKYLVTGFNYTYAYKASGTAQTLKEHMKKRGISVKIISPVMSEGEVVSSTKIRNALMEGDVLLANEMLGRNFSITSTVVKGAQLGRTIGFPTINFEIHDRDIVLKNGVYVSRVKLNDGRVFGGITNIGYKPTVKKEPAGKNIETYIFDFDEDIYGQTVRVEFIVRLRDEQKFCSLDELRHMLEKNKLDAQKILGVYQQERA